ncbi:bifunctional DNA primase/polymerase [Bradyrhizobium sp. 27S5]|uniref:bifunctional DNA primase/polymerase n=1 Tax=Bradyrhizobium sp. 27S5 TaxID=3139728 RepID=UPI0030CB8ED2
MPDNTQGAEEFNPVQQNFDTLEPALDALREMPWLYLFPVHPDKKGQPLLRDYLKRASNDPEILKSRHGYWKKVLGKDCWWGIAPALSGLVFADVDTKEGKRGEETFDLFEMVYSWPATRIIGTPSGGRHHWYRSDRPLFAIGRDTTNHPGIDFAQYVILPGCMKSNGTGYTIRQEREIADAPGWFWLEAKRPTDVADGEAGLEPVIDLDQDAAIERASAYLRDEAPPAMEGAGGDATTLNVAMEVKDFGVSEWMTLDLMLSIYNDRCEPPWTYEELEIKVKNAFAYGQNAPGSKSAEIDFFPDGKPEPTPEEKTARLAKTKERRAIKEAVAKPETWASLRENYVYIGQQQRWVRERDGMIWEPGAFDAYFSDIFVPDKNTSTPIGKHLLKLKSNVGVRRFDTFTYRPGLGRNVDGKFNFYVPSDIVAKEGDTARWDRHLEYLFPDATDRNHLLNWLAWILQNLDKKPKHALVILGTEPGTGKSFIADVLTMLIGSGNCTPIDQETLERSHNGWAMRTKLIVCEEVRGLGHYNSKGAKALHIMITQERITVDEKNMAPVTLDPFLPAVFLMTNSRAALRPDDGDRRYLIIETTVKPQPEGYYFPLFDILEDRDALSAIKWQLENRDLSGYDARARAPVTVAKARMTAEASSGVEQWMAEHAENAPLCYKLVTIAEIIDKLPRDLQSRHARAEVRDVLRRKFNGKAVENPIRPDGKKGDAVRVWAIGPDAAATINGDLLAVWRADHGTRSAATAEAEDDFSA